MSDARVISKINHCSYTGVETQIDSPLLKQTSCELFTDREGNRRLIHKAKGKGVSGIIFDKQGLVLQMFTKKDYRRKGLMKHLLALSYLMGIRSHFDDNLTKDGKAFVNRPVKQPLQAI